MKSAWPRVANLWCRRRDLNPHAPKGTSPSSWRVCLFRHSDVEDQCSPTSLPYWPVLAAGTVLQPVIWSTKPGTESEPLTPPTRLFQVTSDGGVKRGRTQ